MKKSDSMEVALRDEVSGLREKIDELTSRLLQLEGSDGNGNAVVRVANRRDLLKLFGAAAAGAAGTVILRPLPVGAAATNNVVLGATADGTTGHNDSNATTHLAPTSGSTPSPLVQIEGIANPTIPTNPGATSHQGSSDNAISMPLLLVVAPYGVFPGGATPAYPGFAPVVGIGGPVNDNSTGTTQHVAEGVDGFAAVDITDAVARGAGVVGGSDNDIGVVGTGSTDLAAFGAGYIAQRSITDTNGNDIAGPPPMPVYNFEQARDVNGVLWLSNVDGSWRRVNSVIPIPPVRVIDTRSSQGSIGGITGPLAANSAHTWTIGGLHGIPANAIGIVGNLTAITPQAAGFMTIYPTGQNAPAATSVNYLAGVPAMSNLCMVVFGGTNKNQVNIYVSGNGSTQCVLDVSGYII